MLTIAAGAALSRPSISFQTRLMAVFCALLVVGIAGLAASMVSIHQIKRQVEVSHEAHHELASYLHLANNSHLILKQMTATALADIPNILPIGTQLQQAMRAELAAIRGHLDGAAVSDAERARTLAQLERLQLRLEELDARYNNVVSLQDNGEEEEAHAALQDLVKTSNYQEIFSILAGFIDHAHEDVHNVDDNGRTLTNRAESIVYLQMLFTVPFMILAAIYLRHHVRTSLSALTTGTDAVAQGSLEHRIPDLASSEFHHLGRSFNRMAGQLSGQREALQRLNQGLEETVAERTADLRIANEKLEKTDRMRRRLFADISHELRTPLTIIRGEAEVSLRGREKPASAYRESLTRIVTKCGQMGRLVDDLLFMARSDSGEARFDFRTLAIGPLLSEVVRDFTPAAQRKDIRLDLDVDDLGTLSVNGDGGRLRQVFSVLIDNAVRYCGAGSAIHVTGTLEERDAVLRLEDTGPGIAPDDLPHVFTRFYRGHNAAQSSAGTGLGLPVAKAIIDAHGGRITLDNRAGGGTVATIRLPIVASSSGAAPSGLKMGGTS